MLIQWIVRITDVREHEVGRVLRMFSLLGLIIATSYVLKPVRSALFLSQFGAESLPYVYLVVAAVLGVVATTFTSFATKARLTRLFSIVAVGFALSLLAFWLGARADWPFTGFVFYVWAAIYTALTPSLFWLFANYVFYPNEGRRLFPVVMAGGLLGSIVGGAMTSLLVARLGTTGLLPVGTLLLFGVALLVQQNGSSDRDRIKERRAELDQHERRRRGFGKSESPLRLITRSRYLAMIAALIFLTGLTSTLVDYQFNVVVEQSFESTDELTSFFGTFFAAINVVAFVLQLLVTSRLLNTFGVSAGLAMLPVALLGASAGFVLFPVLAAAVLMKTADDGLSNSVNRASVEVLYLPVSFSVKNRIKAWLDLMVERASRGVAGLVILLSTSTFSLAVAQISWITIGLLSGWVALAIALSSEYVRTLRSSLAKRDIASFETRPRDQESLAVFESLLSPTEHDEREVLYALELLRGVDSENIVARIRRLVSHPSPSVRRAALAHFRDLGPEHSLSIEELSTRAEDEDAATGAEAIVLWLEADEGGARLVLDAAVAGGDWERVRAVLDAVTESSRDMEPRLPQPWLQRLVAGHQSSDPEERSIAARAIGLLPSSRETELLPMLASEPDPNVAKAAVLSAGRLRHEASFDALVSQLERRSLRLSARRALAQFGSAAIDRLEQRLEDPDERAAVRFAIPQVLAAIPDSKSATALCAQLPAAHPKLHFQIVKSLGKLHETLRARERTSSDIPSRKVDEVIEWERKLGWELVSWLAAMLPTNAVAGSGAHALLIQALEERCEFTRERIFRLLGLIYTSDEMFRAWDRIVNGTPSVRGAALEYLSNVLSRDHLTLIPWLEAESWQKLAAAPSTSSGVATPSRLDAFARMLRTEDHWLAACATAYLSELEEESALLESELLSLVSHESSFLRQEAQRAVGTGPYASD